MRVTRRTHWQVRFQNVLFTFLFLTVVGLIAALSVRYNYQADWTASSRNTLSPASQELLEQLAGPVTIVSFAQNPNTQQQITKLVARYQRHKPDLALEFINPETAPDQVRELGVQFESELVIKQGGRQEKLQELTEEGLTNALSRVARNAEALIVFLEGHGERNPHGQANFDLSNFTQQLETKGIQIQTLNLSAQSQIPDATQVLVIASPQIDLLPGEVELLRSYIKNGGNLLWLAEPGPLYGLGSLAEDLGIKFLPGTVIDPNTRLLLGRGSATFALVPEYGNHPITERLASVTLFPQAVAMEGTKESGWRQRSILSTLSRTWVETSPLEEEIQFDEEDDILGPLTIGYAFERESQPPPSAEVKDEDSSEDSQEITESATQRVAVIGDGDFLSNAYLGNGSNLDLGLNLINWLAYEDRLITVPARARPDTSLELSSAASWIIGGGFLFGLPILLLGTGLLIWWRRRQR
jgi:ABC-type uncharacterized transport system involved in gliding motility auxiliary subunit